MAEPDYEVAIVGGGVVGLAAAARLAPEVASLVLFERHEAFGQETSSRNSEVVHAGIYYECGSGKARFCVEGRRLLYDFCETHGVPYEKCGKTIVATEPDEVPALEALAERGKANGVEGLCMLSREEVLAREPHVRAVAGLYSAESGIVNAHGLMDAFARLAEAAGADLVCGAAVLGLESGAGGWVVRYRDSEEEGAITARTVVNAAGLGAQDVMRLAGLSPEAMGLTLHLCKGEYFSVQGQKRRYVNGLVYPLPRANLLSLGIHTVKGLGGECKLGPSAFYVDAIDYTVDAENRERFYDDVRPYLPFLAPEDLVPDMSGIRPKLAGPGEPARDFHIAHEVETGAAGFVNLAGIDSPGLTASPAIAARVAELVLEGLRA